MKALRPRPFRTTLFLGPPVLALNTTLYFKGKAKQILLSLSISARLGARARLAVDPFTFVRARERPDELAPPVHGA